jgi:hypothetical protein
VLCRGDQSVVAFWPDAAILSRPAGTSPLLSLFDTMLRIRAGTLINIALPLQAVAARWQGPGQAPLTVPELRWY